MVQRKHYSAAFTPTLVIPHIISTGKKCWDLGKRQARHLRGFFRINKNRNWHNRRSDSHLRNRRYRIMSGKNPSNGQSVAMFTYFSYRKQISARRINIIRQTTIRSMKGYLGSAIREIFAQLWNPKSNKFLLWHPESWTLKSGVPLTTRIRNPNSIDKSSWIQIPLRGI